MNELIAQVLTVARAMWRRRWIGLAVAWAVAVLGALLVMRVPDRFEANARVYVDTKSVLKPLMRDLTVEPDIDQTLQMLARTLITRPNVELLMKKAKLETLSMTEVQREAMVARLMKEIKLTSLSRDNVFTFSYRDTDKEKAREVVSQLVNFFVESDLGAKMRDVDAARGFIDQQIKTYEGRLAEAENRLKEFKLRNIDSSDSSGKDFFARISALTDELGRLNLDLRAAEQARDALKRELSGESTQILPDVIQPQMTFNTPELDARLESQRRQLDELLRRYTELHPDVISTKRLIERLEAQREQEIQAQRRAAAANPAKVGTAGSVFQQTRLALAESEATVAALRVRASDTQTRLARLRASASRVPQIEAEFAQLNRDYDIVRRNYDALVAQREKALMSEEVDATRLAHFRVIDPPRTSDKPVFPNRLVMAMAALAAALAAGIAATFLWVQLVPTVDDTRSLQRFSGLQPLGSVSMIVTPALSSRRRRHGFAFASGTVALLAAYGFWLALVALPAGA